MIRHPEATLRLLEPNELEDWIRLLNRANQGCPGFEPWVPLDYVRLQAQGYADPCSPLVAVRGRELLGGVSFAAGAHSKRGRLSELAVQPDARRHGLGRALAAAALAEQRARGVRHIQALDWPSAAHDGLYSGLGFEAARRYHLLAWDLRDELPAFDLDQAITTRRAGLADLETLAEVYAPVDLADSYWSRPPEEMEDLRHLAFWADLKPRPGEAEPDRMTLVAEISGRVVGAVSVQHDRQLNETAGRRDGYLRRGGVAVLPSFRPREVGRRLVRAALDTLRAMGLERALVWAYAPLTGTTPLVQLYQDCGARELRQLKAWDLECQP